MTSNRLTIFDTTLRDGEQAPGFSLRIDEKLEMARQLSSLGVDIIEAGFPIASEADAEAVRVDLVAASMDRSSPRWRAVTPPTSSAPAWALQPAPRRRIHTFIATSDLHLERKLRISREACLRDCRGRGAPGPQLHRRRAVLGRGCDAQRSRLPLPRRRSGHRGGRARPSTCPTPSATRRRTRSSAFFSAILTRVPNADKATFSTHCHDDLGLAVANTLAAVQAGARQVECTINGIGERAGNASLEEIVMATRVRSDRLPYRHGDQHARDLPVEPDAHERSPARRCRRTRRSSAATRSRTKPGIHQDGMLKDRRTYEIMRPEEVGVPQATLVLGKHSGRHAVQRRCEQLGITLERQQLDQVYRAVIAHADREKIVSDRDLTAIVDRVRGGDSRRQALSGSTVAGHDFTNTPAESGYGHGV